ncbi:hypothetical protein Tsubulata_003996 [Turnera subulata]|uniref:Uncharacterized protein n=1 Tax=Turnera subulata TaxID=218843 RepID=A0A9Q0FM91_9ROSI|nr:hypothetical protein Tsubulata_003996 [Turnera subulata]
MGRIYQMPHLLIVRYGWILLEAVGEEPFEVIVQREINAVKEQLLDTIKEQIVDTVKDTVKCQISDTIRSEMSEHFGQMMQMFLAQMNPQFRAPEYVTRPVVMPCGTRPLEQQQWTNLPFGHLSFTGQQQIMPTVGASSSQPWQQAVSSSMPTFPSVSTAAPPIDQPTYVNFPNSIPMPSGPPPRPTSKNNSAGSHQSTH